MKNTKQPAGLARQQQQLARLDNPPTYLPLSRKKQEGPRDRDTEGTNKAPPAADTA